jgi:hypothetical protein
LVWGGKEASVIYERSGLNTVHIGGRDVEFEFRILDIHDFGDKLILLLGPDDNYPRNCAFRNILAIDNDGEVVWQAELPTKKDADGYWKIESVQPLVAMSFCSYECELDESSGRIIRKTFYK